MCIRLLSSSYRATDGQGGDPLPAPRVLKPNLAFPELLRQNPCGHWHTERANPYVDTIKIVRAALHPINAKLLYISSSIAPAPQVDPNAAAQDKDSSLCIMPRCNRKKYVDGGKTHDYCGKTHAQQGKQMGILRKCIFIILSVPR